MLISSIVPVTVNGDHHHQLQEKKTHQSRSVHVNM
jgi:hypothetical protein